MVTHDVATPDGRETNAGGLALAAEPLAVVNRAVFEIAAKRGGDHLPHFQGRAGRRINLVPVVGLDDFDVIAGGERAGGGLEQLERDIHAHTHVGRHDDGDVARGVCNLGLLRLVKAGGANHQANTEGAADLQMGQRALWPGEIDQNLSLGQTELQVSGDGNPAVLPQESACIQTYGRALRLVQRATEPAIWCRQQGLYQHLPHAPGGAGHGNALGCVLARAAAHGAAGSSRG